MCSVSPSRVSSVVTAPSQICPRRLASRPVPVPARGPLCPLWVSRAAGGHLPAGRQGPGETGEEMPTELWPGGPACARRPLPAPALTQLPCPACPSQEPRDAWASPPSPVPPRPQLTVLLLPHTTARAAGPGAPGFDTVLAVAPHCSTSDTLVSKGPFSFWKTPSKLCKPVPQGYAKLHARSGPVAHLWLLEPEALHACVMHTHADTGTPF